MKSLLSIGLFSVLLILPACATEPEPEPAMEPTLADTTEAPAAAADPLTGTWTGDWGPSAEHRNPVTVELTLNGNSVSGTINPGDQDIELTSGTFDPATGSVMLEAEAQGRGGVMHYTIDGQVEGGIFSGDWTHEDGTGTFSVTR